MEIDFLIAKPITTSRHNISPIEVKSGQRYTLNSLRKCIAKYGSQLSTPYVLHDKDMKNRRWDCVYAFIYDTIALNDMGKQITYQELLAAYNKLLMENEFLHKEVDRLQALLNSKDIHMTQPIMKQHLSLEEKVSVFRNLFKGREDVFARRWYSRTSGKSGYQPVCRNEWDRAIV